MNSRHVDKLGVKKISPARRKIVCLSKEELVRFGSLEDGKSTPFLIEPAITGLSLVDWAKNNRSIIEASLYKHGAILFRGFNMGGMKEYEQFVKAVSDEMLDYRERSSPRTQVGDRIYTSTDYPPNQSIFLHNENSYAHLWPLKIFFFCVNPGRRDGQTPIADTRKVLERIDHQIVARFRERKVLYLRNFGSGLGLSWRTVFQSKDKSAVEEYCRNAGYEVRWREGDRLTIRRIGQAVATHPKTGEQVWFNHAAFFHVSTLGQNLREALLAEFQEEELPNNTYYGDGSPIEPSVLDEIRQAYRQEAIMFDWQQNDLLMLDNMLMAHGRAPFVGPRTILVAMADPFTN